MRSFPRISFAEAVAGGDATTGFKLTLGSPFWYESNSRMGMGDNNRTFATVGRHQLGFRLARDGRSDEAQTKEPDEVG